MYLKKPQRSTVPVMIATFYKLNYETTLDEIIVGFFHHSNHLFCLGDCGENSTARLKIFLDWGFHSFLHALHTHLAPTLQMHRTNLILLRDSLQFSKHLLPCLSRPRPLRRVIPLQSPILTPWLPFGPPLFRNEQKHYSPNHQENCSSPALNDNHWGNELHELCALPWSLLSTRHHSR